MRPGCGWVSLEDPSEVSWVHTAICVVLLGTNLLGILKKAAKYNGINDSSFLECLRKLLHLAMPAEREGWIAMKEMDSKCFLIGKVCEWNADRDTCLESLLTLRRAAGRHLRPEPSQYFSSWCLCELVTVYPINPLASWLQKYCVLSIPDSRQALNCVYTVSFWTGSLSDLFAATCEVF